MPDRVGLHDVRRVHVHDAGERRRGRVRGWRRRQGRHQGRRRGAADARRPAAAPAAGAPAPPAAAAAAAAAAATAAHDGAPAGAEQRPSAGADGGEAVEDHRGPEHTVPRQLDQAGRAGDTQVPGLAGPEERRAQPGGPPAPVELRLVVSVLAHSNHHYR